MGKNRGKEGGHRDQDRVIHRDMISDEKNILPLFGNIFPPPDTGKIEGKAEESKSGGPGRHYEKIRKPKPHAMNYFLAELLNLHRKILTASKFKFNRSGINLYQVKLSPLDFYRGDII